MKRLFGLGLTIGLLVCSVGCRPLVEREVRGELKVNPKWGPAINLYDVETKSYKSLSAGRYRLKFPRLWTPLFGNPKIEVLDEQGRRIATIEIPKGQIKRDGTFEIFDTTNKNSLQFNVLGGRREVILKRERSSVIREYCTYTESYPCLESCTDSSGNQTSCMTTCTRTVSGDRDALYEKQTFKSFYRILFDGADMMNAASFDGESGIQDRVVQLNSTSCR